MTQPVVAPVHIPAVLFDELGRGGDVERAEGAVGRREEEAEEEGAAGCVGVQVASDRAWVDTGGHDFFASRNSDAAVPFAGEEEVGELSLAVSHEVAHGGGPKGAVDLLARFERDVDERVEGFGTVPNRGQRHEARRLARRVRSRLKDGKQLLGEEEVTKMICGIEFPSRPW